MYYHFYILNKLCILYLSLLISKQCALITCANGNAAHSLCYFIRWSEDASPLVNPACPSIFNGEFEAPTDQLRDSICQFLVQLNDVNPLKQVLQRLMPGMLDVTTRQLSDFLEGGKFGGPPVPMPDGLDHCPLHNLLGERVFGDLDFDMGKRRNASLHTRSSLHMINHNRTGQWLQGQQDSKSLLSYARKKGRLMREHYREQERLVMIRLRRKLAENRQRQLEKEVKQAASKTDLIRRMTAVGGPCETAADVDSLTRCLRNESEENLINALRDQVRYQKQILKRKGQLRLGGTTEELIAGLKEHLGQQFQQSVAGAVPMELDEWTEPFVFQHQGQWVAVYFDNKFYIGQVTHVLSKERAVIKYLEQIGTSSMFKWPRVADEAETEAVFVFEWDIDVNPASNDMRQWRVSGLPAIVDKYQSLL